MSWRQLAVGLAVIALVVGLLGVRALLSGGSGAGPSASAAGSASAVESVSATEPISSAASTTPTEEPSPTSSPSPSPAPVPTAKPTAKPTAVPPTPVPPTPVPTVTCIPEPNGWQAYFQRTVVVGQTMEITHSYMPVGQKLHLAVDYPNGQTVTIGDAYSVVVGDHTELQWIWTVPADMTPGQGTARWTGGCGTRVYDGDVDFTIAAS